MLSIWKVNHQILLYGLCALSCDLGAPKKKKSEGQMALRKFPPCCRASENIQQASKTLLYWPSGLEGRKSFMLNPAKVLQYQGSDGLLSKDSNI